MIFKATKEVKDGETVELGTIDCTKYRQIRIGVFVEGVTIAGFPSAEFDRLRVAKDNLFFAKESRDASKIEQATSQFEKARKEYGEAYSSPFVSIYGIESGENILIDKFIAESRSIVIDSPPSKLIVKVSGSGTYKIFVWASM